MKGIYGDKRKQCLLLEVGIGWEHAQENSDGLATAITLRSHLSPIAKSGTSCPLPVPMKLS